MTSAVTREVALVLERQQPETAMNHPKLARRVLSALTLAALGCTAVLMLRPDEVRPVALSAPDAVGLI